MARHELFIQGGLGDCILGFARRGSRSGYVEALRRENPSSHFALRLMTTTHAGLELFGHCELFDSIEHSIWDGRGFADGIETMWADLPWKRPAIALSHGEACDAKVITVRRYVAVHPFAGTPSRTFKTGALDVERIVRPLCEAGHQVVLLGSSFSGVVGRGKTRTVEADEWCDLELPNLFNLVGRASVRLQAHLAMQASAFVGSFSAYHCAAFCADVPAFVAAPPEFAKFFAMEHPTYGRMDARPGTRLGYFGDVTEREIEQWARQSLMTTS